MICILTEILRTLLYLFIWVKIYYRQVKNSKNDILVWVYWWSKLDFKISTSINYCYVVHISVVDTVWFHIKLNIFSLLHKSRSHSWTEFAFPFYNVIHIKWGDFTCITIIDFQCGRRITAPKMLSYQLRQASDAETGNGTTRGFL